MPQTITAQIEGQTFEADFFAAEGARKNLLLFCLPGGGASKDYFDLAPDYSFAANMAARGYDVLAMDHPGTATNKLPDDYPFLSPRKSALYICQSLKAYRSSLGLSEQPTIGIGHSMGGMMTVLSQAAGASFAALALLGSSAGGLEWGLDDYEKTFMDNQAAFTENLEALTLRKFKTPFPPGMGGPSGKSITFGGENPAITQRLRETSCELYAAGGMMSMTRGSFLSEAHAVDVPIFFAFGDHDIGIPPEDAPKDFGNEAVRTVIVLPKTGHNSFAFSSLTVLCEKLDNWVENTSHS